jgi:hypothetical protein
MRKRDAIVRVLYEDLVERIKTMSEGIDDLRQRP